MSKGKLLLIVGLVFCAGFVFGIVVTRVVVRRTVFQVAANPDRLRSLIERRLTSKLHLSPDQRTKVNAVLSKTQTDLRALRSQFAPPFAAIMSSAQEEISAVLTTEQREKFAKLREENRSLWQPK